jgi:transcriptional regulator with XRE-family HTH domain
METKTAWRNDHQKSVDKYVGGRLRLRRRLLGQTQSDLGNAVGLTFQQIQKYEKGASRIGAGRLWQLGRILIVPVSYFFDGLDDHPPITTAIEIPLSELELSKQELSLCHALRNLSAAKQKCLFDLVKTFAADSNSSQQSRVPLSE